MFILIENHSDDINQTCRLVGTYQDKGTAQTVMHQLYNDAHKRNEGEEIEMHYLHEDDARAWWTTGFYDFYDWYIFEA